MTRKLNLVAVLLCFAFLCPTFVPSAHADMWNKKTILTFSGPVKVANTTLPAGTYVFKLMDSPGTRHVVQIFNQNENHLYATVLAMPAFRLEPADHTVIKFAETSASGDTASGTIPADGLPIKQWFYPGDNYGQEFPLRPAALTTTTAVSETSQSAAEEPAPAPAAESAPTANSEPEQPAEMAEAQPAPNPEPQTQAQPQQPAPQADQAPSTSAEQPSTPSSLPKTASPIPLIGLVGLLSLATAAGLELVVRRRIPR
ncbi:MAG TPA: hypothetical protein VG204_03440 [Terriglobia bacterium]|nr:hypothetical protein [Terriglobia bacterium]